MNAIPVPQQRIGSQRAVPVCPYRGLRPYTEEDAEYFFGREREIRLVIDNLKAYRLTVLYGPSGVGKSSILLAGVVRGMNRDEEESLATFDVRESVVVYCNHWRDDPMLVLGGFVKRRLLEAFPDSELTLPDRLDAASLIKACDSLDIDVYLVLDQFEEYFLYHDDDAPGRAFVAELSAISAPTARVNVLIALRDDAFTCLDRFEGHVPRLFDKTLRLDHLDYNAAREAVLRPLQRYNELAGRDDQMGIEPELVDRVLDQVQAGRIRIGGASEEEAMVAGRSTPESRIETPFLQLLLTRVWSEERAHRSSRLRVKTLDHLGGAEQIVRTHLDAVMGELPKDLQDVAACIFRHLVTRSGTKIAYTAEDLAYIADIPDRARVTDVLERLSAGGERVLRPVPPPVGQPGAPRYEIFHDVMAPAILDWRGRYVAERKRADSERALVQAKHEAEERDRESRRRLRISLIVSATLAVLLLAVFGLGFVAQRNYAAAKRQQQLAEYEKYLDSNPAASLHAALQAWRNKTWWQEHSPEAERDVRNALDANRQRVVLDGDDRNVVTSRFAPDGRTILTVRDDGTAALFWAATGHLRHRFTPPGDLPRSPLTDASFSSDSSMVVTAATNGQVLVYDAVSGRQRATLADSGGPAFATWASLRGRPVVLTYSRNGTPALWDPTARNAQVARYGTPTSGTKGADLSPDGRYVVTLGSDRRARVWELASGRLVVSSPVLGIDAAQPLFVTAGSGGVAVLTRTPQAWQVVLWDWRGAGSVKPTPIIGPEQLAVTDDRRLLAAALDKRVIVFDAAAGKSRGQTPEARDRVTALDFSRDGRRLVVGDHNGSAVIWSTADIGNTTPNPNGINSRWTRPVAELVGTHGSVSDAQFNPHDPSSIVTTGSDGKARIWGLPNQTIQFGTAGSSVLNADVSQDGKIVGTAESSVDRPQWWLRVWRSDNGALQREWSRPGEQFRKVLFTPDAAKVVAIAWSALPTAGQQLVTAYAPSAYRPLVWTWRTNEWNGLEKNDRPITLSLAVSPDGRTVAASDSSNQVVVWDLNTGKITRRLGRPNTENDVRDIAYIGSTRLAVAGGDGTVRIWDLRDSSHPIGDGTGASGGITAMAVSRDGTRLVTATESRNLFVWDVSDGRIDGQPKATIRTEVGTIKGIALSRDGNLLAAGVADGAVHMWRWRDRDWHEFVVLPRHSEAVDSVKFTADDQAMVTRGDEGRAVVFPCTACKPFPEVLRDAQRLEDSSEGGL